MMKEGGVSHQGSEYHPYANGNMQHMYNNSRQTPDSGLGNEELRNSMNNAGVGGDNSGAPTGSGAPPGFQPNPYYGMAPQSGNAQQSQYNDQQQQQQFRQKQYSGSQHDGGRFEQRSGPPSIVTMQTSPPNMDQEGGAPYPNYGSYSQYGQGGQQYGGMDRNYNAPHQMAGRSHSNYSESSSSTLNMAGVPPDASALSGQPLMAGGPHGPMMGYSQGGGPPMGAPYHPAMQQMQQGGFMFNPQAAMAHQQMVMMQGGQMGQQQTATHPMHHPHPLPMSAPQGGASGGGPGMAPPAGPSQSVSPPQSGMMMMPMGQQTVPMGHPGQQIYYNPAMMAQRGPMVGAGPEGFVQFTYPAPHPHGGAPQQQQQSGYAPMRGPMMQHQRSVNSPALSDNTDGQSVHGGAGSIGMWTGPPDQQQSQQGSPPGSIHPMQGVTPQHMSTQMMQSGMMVMQPQMMSASYPGSTGVPPYGGQGGPRMAPTPQAMMTPQQQLAMQHAMQQGGGMHMQHMAQMQQQFGPGGYPQQPQTQTGYWHGPPNQGGARGGYGGGRGGGSREGSVRGGGGWRGGRPGSRQQYNSRNNSITSGGGRGGGGGGGGRDTEENSKGSTPTMDDVTFSDMSLQLESSLRLGADQSMQSMESAAVASPAHVPPHKQLLELADSKCSSPPAEPHPHAHSSPPTGCEGAGDVAVLVPQEELEETAGTAPVPTTPRSEQRKERKELLEMKKTPKQSDKSSSPQTIPVDPVPHGETAVSGGRKYSEVAGKMTCTYCKKQKRPEEEYTSHRVRDPVSMTCTCPLLRATGCQFCGGKGDNAHDQFFCSERQAADQARELGVHHHMPHPSHVPHVPHGEGAYRGGPKRGGGGGHYQNRGGRGGGGHGGHGGDRKYESRRVQ